MQRELGALTESGKILGVRSFYSGDPDVTFAAWHVVRHVTGNDQDYLRKIPRAVVQISALL